MKKKTFTFLIVAFMVSLGATSQTVRDNIDKAIRDKNAKENSAKADVIIQKKIIADTIQTKVTPAKVVSNTQQVYKIKQKKRKYKSKKKSS